jgi:hypothetical protein
VQLMNWFSQDYDFTVCYATQQPANVNQ